MQGARLDSLGGSPSNRVHSASGCVNADGWHSHACAPSCLAHLRSYKLLARAYPYMARRLLTDPAPELRESFEDLILKVGSWVGHTFWGCEEDGQSGVVIGGGVGRRG